MNDREIRNSIVEIRFDRGKVISDKMKSKLYLSGITNYEDDDIKEGKCQILESDD